MKCELGKNRSVHSMLVLNKWCTKEMHVWWGVGEFWSLTQVHTGAVHLPLPASWDCLLHGLPAAGRRWDHI